MKTRLTYIVQGIAVSVLGAFVWVFFYLHRVYQGHDKFLVVLISALVGLLMTSIYLVPLGAALGLLLPPIAIEKTLGLSLLAGVASGILIAGFSSLLVVVAFELRLGAAFLSMCPVCSGMIVGWMLLMRWRGRQVPVPQQAHSN